MRATEPGQQGEARAGAGRSWARVPDSQCPLLTAALGDVRPDGADRNQDQTSDFASGTS